MKIATFNVNSIRARLPIVTRWLKDNKPDVLCVQETKVRDEEFPTQPFDEIGYNCAFSGRKSYNGVALFTPHKIRRLSFGFDDEPRDKPRLIRAEIGDISIVNTYVPQGFEPDSEKFLYKLRWFERLKKMFQANYRPTDALLWLGDFNIAPEPRDLYDPENLYGSVCYHPDVHKALHDVMSWGFIDLFRKHCDQAGRYTFWDYRLRNSFKRNLGWRLDHIMATKPLAEKSTACYIDTAPRTAERPSDHTPVVAEFNL